MRHSLFLAGALSLAACSSSISSLGGNPPAQNTAVAPPAGSNGLRVQFENTSAYSLLFMDFEAPKSVCITSVEPADFYLYENQTTRVEIKGDDQGACKDAAREVHFLMGMVQIGGGRAWKGELHVRYDPQLSVWTGKINEGDRNVDLCSDPPDVVRGAKLEENELIGFHFCKRH